MTKIKKEKDFTAETQRKNAKNAKNFSANYADSLRLCGKIINCHNVNELFLLTLVFYNTNN